MVTTGANPDVAIVMAELKNNHGKSVSQGITSVAAKVFAPVAQKIESATLHARYQTIRSMVSNQCHNQQ